MPRKSAASSENSEKMGLPIFRWAQLIDHSKNRALERAGVSHRPVRVETSKPAGPRRVATTPEIFRLEARRPRLAPSPLTGESEPRDFSRIVRARFRSRASIPRLHRPLRRVFRVGRPRNDGTHRDSTALLKRGFCPRTSRAAFSLAPPRDAGTCDLVLSCGRCSRSTRFSSASRYFA
jgi:hypothetical protein